MAAELLCEESIDDRKKLYLENLAIIMPAGFTIVGEPIADTDDVLISVRTQWNVRFKLDPTKSAHDLKNDLIDQFCAGVETLISAYRTDARV